MFDKTVAQGRVDTLYVWLGKKGLVHPESNDFDSRHEALVAVFEEGQMLAELAVLRDPKRRLGKAAVNTTFARHYIDGMSDEQLADFTEVQGWTKTTAPVAHVQRTLNTYISLKQEQAEQDSTESSARYDIAEDDKCDLWHQVGALLTDGRISKGYAQQLLLLFGGTPSATVSHNVIARAYQQVTVRIRTELKREQSDEHSDLIQDGRKYLSLIVGTSTKDMRGLPAVVLMEAALHSSVDTAVVEAYVETAVAHALNDLYGVH
jgi:hypothetical protein